MTCPTPNQTMADLDQQDEEPKKPLMPPIDLTLAVNFIPAVVCLSKSALISFSLCLLDPGEHLGGFVIFVLMLNIDRAVSSARIFDENAVQCCILASWVINFLRSLVDSPKIAAPIATFLWLIFSYCLVVEPRRVQYFFVMYGQGSGGVYKRVLPGLITSVFVMVMAFTHADQESSAVKSARSIGFSILCVAWVYVVSVWRPRTKFNGSCVFECHLLLSRFCPILYIHWVAAILYAIGCVALLTWHYIQIHVGKGGAVRVPTCDEDACSLSEVTVMLNEAKKQSSSNVSNKSHIELNLPGPVEEMNTILEEDDEDLEACFRAACQSRMQQGS